MTVPKQEFFHYTQEMAIGIDTIGTFPASPGVYLMKGEDGKVLYVGKAANLKQRLRSYFRQAGDARYHIRFLMNRVADIDYIVTDTEKEALILENTLIKQHRPRYNFNLRDDKTYFSLRMDMAEEFPRLTLVRKVPRDGARYFGPYSSASAAREVLKELYKIFPLRHYPLETCRRRGRPCLFHQIRQCSAPCQGLISLQDYAALAEGTALLLAGRNRELISILKTRMATAAAAEQYEQAVRFRDLLRAIEITVERQKMVTRGGDADVVGFNRGGNRLTIVIIFIRGGSMIGSRNYSLPWELDDGEGLASFLNEYYSREVFIPEELLLPLPLPEHDALAELLGERRGKKVVITSPRRGVKADLVTLATRNAAAVTAEQTAPDRTEIALRELQEHLLLPLLPARIECYDISNIGGEHAVGSRVVFSEGRPDKPRYRRYRIRTVAGADDFAMMREVFLRRFREGRDDGRPELIVVDGGLGQLGVLIHVLKELAIEGVAAAGLAKSRVTPGMTGGDIERSPERVFLPGRKNPLLLGPNSPALLLLTQVRDEAHRFALSYHRKLRGKAALSSILGEIPGVGEKRQKDLLRHFGSIKRIRQATAEELLEVNGISRKIAEAIREYLSCHP